MFSLKPDPPAAEHLKPINAGKLFCQQHIWKIVFVTSELQFGVYLVIPRCEDLMKLMKLFTSGK
jgi:hypothetical protein